MKNQRLKVEALVQSSNTRQDLTILVDRAEAIGAHFHLLLSTLVYKRSLVDVGHKAPIGCVLRVADVVTIHGALATNIASLSHFKTPFYKFCRLERAG